MFENQTKFKIHYRKCSDKRNFWCKKCDQTFIGMVIFNNHQQTHKTSICKSCGKAVFRTSMKAHTANCGQKDKDKKYKCEKCDYTSNRKEHLKPHTKTHITAEKEKKKVICFECINCKKTFENTKQLKFHIKTHLKQSL